MYDKYMRLAIEEAQRGADRDEVPVGAVIVKDGKVLTCVHNEKESNNCAIYHAEIVAIMEASRILGNWYLEGCDIYVTLEPCAMCAGAILNSRIDNVYYGAYDAKAGCCGTIYNLLNEKRFNHRPNVVGGILEDECAKLLTDYFRGKGMLKVLNNNLKLLKQILMNGGEVDDSATSYIDEEVDIGSGIRIGYNVSIKGNSVIGDNVTIGANSIVDNSKVGSGAIINQSIVINSIINTNEIIEPFSVVKDRR